MFDLTSSVMMRRTSSNGSSTSSLSLSPVGWSPSRPTMSPPSVTSYPSTIITTDFTVVMPNTTGSRRSLSPEPSRLNLSTSHQAYAFPSWPVRDCLTQSSSPQTSPTTSYFSPNYIPNSRISDDDLEALDFTKQKYVSCQPDEATLGMSWSAINNPSSQIIPALQVCETRRRLPPPPPQYRRRSSSRRSPSRKSHKTLGAIAE